MQTGENSGSRRARIARRAGLALMAATLIPAGVAQATVTPVQIGNGKDPSLVVSADGHAHVVWVDANSSGAVWDYCDLAPGAKSCGQTHQLVQPQSFYQSGPTIFPTSTGFEVWGDTVCGTAIHDVVRYALDPSGQTTAESCIAGETGGGDITPGDDFLDSRPGHDWLLGTGEQSADESYFHAFQFGDTVPGAQVFNGQLGFTYNPSVAESGPGDTLVVAAGRSAADSHGHHANFAVYGGLASGASIDALNTQSNWATGFSIPGSSDIDYSASVHAISGGPDVSVIAASHYTEDGSVLVNHITRPGDPSSQPEVTSAKFVPPAADRFITNLEGAFDPKHGLTVTWASHGKLHLAREVKGTMLIQGTVSALKGGIDSEQLAFSSGGKGFEAYSTDSHKIMVVPVTTVTQEHPTYKTLTHAFPDKSVASFAVPEDCVVANEPFTLGYKVKYVKHPSESGPTSVILHVDGGGTVTVKHAPFTHSFTLSPNQIDGRTSIPISAIVTLKAKNGKPSGDEPESTLKVCQ